MNSTCLVVGLVNTLWGEIIIKYHVNVVHQRLFATC